jgi:hypothetical protein
VELENSATLGLLPVFRVTGESEGLLEGVSDDPSCGKVEVVASTSSEAELRLAHFWKFDD